PKDPEFKKRFGPRGVLHSWADGKGGQRIDDTGPLTNCADKHKGKSGHGDYNDVMVAHDENIGRMLAKLDELGIVDDTIVMYSTDNGPHYNSWPDGAITPFRSEKNTNWEGGWRVPIFVRWPSKIKAGSVFNDIASHQDWLPTLLAAAGDPDIAEK